MECPVQNHRSFPKYRGTVGKDSHGADIEMRFTNNWGLIFGLQEISEAVDLNFNI